MQSGTFQDFIDIMYDIKKPSAIEKKPKEGAKPKQKKPKAKKDSTEQLSVKNSELSLKSNNGVKKSVRKDTFEDLHGEGHSHDEGSIAKDSLDEGSTMASLSPLHSLETLSSGTPATENKSTKKNKSKSKSNKKKKKAGRHDFRLKFKTEICKYWVDYGTCQYGDQCAFAHGTDEIRVKNHLAPNYKTKKCSKFHEEGHCPYGPRCQFVHCLHKEHQLDEEDLIETYEDEVENAEIWFTEDPDCLCMRRNLRYRLPCFLKNVEA